METNSEPLTEAQIKEQQKRMLNFYKENMEYVEVQAKHDKLVADIEEARVRILIARTTYANMKAGPEKQKGETKPGKEGA